MNEEKIEPYYQNNAKQIIDSMFDVKIFKEEITRDDMIGFEDLIAYYLQSQAYTARKIADFQAKWNLKK